MVAHERHDRLRWTCRFLVRSVAIGLITPASFGSVSATISVEVDERQLELLHRRSAKAFLFCLCASVVLG